MFAHSYDASKIAEVRAAARIEEVAGSAISLKRRGPRFVGLCPFHSEKSPSFDVHPAKGFFLCRGCQTGGDVFTFVMKFYDLGFKEAVERLAEQYGIVLDVRPSAQNLAGAMAKLRDPAAQRAVAALIGAEAVSTPEPAPSITTPTTPPRGCVPVTSSNLAMQYLARRGLDAANITIPLWFGLYGDFVGRIVFPLAGPESAYTGRAIYDAKSKYWTTPGDPGARAAYLPGLVPGPIEVLSEGTFDAWAVCRKARRAAAAILGTAVESRVETLLPLLAPRVYVLLDRDAGLKKRKVGSLFVARGVDVWIADSSRLDGPKGDPDDSGAASIDSALANARPFAAVSWDIEDLVAAQAQLTRRPKPDVLPSW